MNQREVRFSEEAAEDLVRLFSFLAEKDPKAAEKALKAIRRGLSLASAMPWSCRRADPDYPLRECVITFGQGGYVAAFTIADDHILVVAVRHQREEDFH